MTLETLNQEVAVPVAAIPAPAAEEARVAPIARTARVQDIDVIRGIALFGVLMMNLAEAFRAPFWGNHRPPDLGLLERVVMRLQMVVLSGKAMSTFSILFGVGLAIFLERASARGPNARWLLARRLLFLIAFGLVHKFFIWEGDILISYGLTGLLALLFLRRGNTLLLITAGICLFAPLLVLIPSVRSFMDVQTLGYYEEALRVYGTGSYFDVVRFRAGEILHIESHRSVLLWADELAKNLLGIVIWRSGIFHAGAVEAHRRALRWIAFGGILIGASYPIYRWVVFELYHPPQGSWSAWRFFLSWTTMLLCAAGYGAGLLLLLRRASWQKWLAVFAPLGRMAFTNYLTQSIVFSTVFYGYGLGLFGKVGYAPTALMGIAFYVLQGFISAFWLRHYQFGPFEWAWRSLTYGRLQPFRRALASDV